MNRRVTIIYSSMTGNSKKMCEAGADVRLVCASDSTGADVENCDALIWGTGNYYAYIPGLLKDWLDREHPALEEKTRKGEMKPRPYFLCCRALGSGAKKVSPLIDELSHRMNLIKVFEPVVAYLRPSPEVLEHCRELGRKLVEVDLSQTLNRDQSGKTKPPLTSRYPG